jgi:hypothetical protein
VDLSSQIQSGTGTIKKLKKDEYTRNINLDISICGVINTGVTL